MLTSDIRSRFITYFEEQGHAVLPSSPLTHPDPQLLFVNSGMVPLKPYFLQEQTPPSGKLTTVQHCIRTLDIEEVGLTSRHGTFFEMCGNFTFGEYFKEKSIQMSWDFLTLPLERGGLGLDPRRLWVTVLESDGETLNLWKELTTVKSDQLQLRTMKDNYWSMGVPGPGGPCSEIYFDRGPEYGDEGGPVVDEDRYMEIWNLVFMQHRVANVRSKTDLTIEGPLPTFCVDTGMGLERVSCVLQGKDSIFETDETWPIIELIERFTQLSYRESDQQLHFRRLTDHLRSSVMILQEGVVPGNSGQSYVLRRLLRRSLRSLHLLSSEPGLLSRLTEEVGQLMSLTYPSLRGRVEEFSGIVEKEERSFRKVLQRGEQKLQQELELRREHGSDLLPGEVGFRLNSTLGFPVEFTREICSEQGFVFDEEGFEELKQHHRNLSRS